MFYPELSPAMRWQLEQHQKMYSMYHSMESGKMALGDQYGETWMMLMKMKMFWMYHSLDSSKRALGSPSWGINMVRKIG